MRWCPALQMSAIPIYTGSRRVPHSSETDHRIRIELETFSIALTRGTETVGSLALGGKSLDDGFRWLAAQLSELSTKELRLQRRDYEMPDHPVSQGANFSDDLIAPLIEIGRYYGAANVCLKTLALTDSRTTAVAIWPHHFDMGGILILDPNRPFEEAPQIGFGMSPGDAQISEPYYYHTVAPPKGRHAPRTSSRWAVGEQSLYRCAPPGKLDHQRQNWYPRAGCHELSKLCD